VGVNKRLAKPVCKFDILYLIHVNKATIIAAILFLSLYPFLAKAQTDLLILEHHGMQTRTYTIGTDIDMQTIYNQWFQGTITDMRHDSVFVNGLPFHYKEISTIRIMHSNFANTVLADGMMVAGVGGYVLGAVNGAYRHDAPKDWYTGSWLVTGAALIVGGFLLTRTRTRIYHIGKKYQLQYMVLNPDKKGTAPALPISPSAN
jgi:hypothetical protein